MAGILNASHLAGLQLAVAKGGDRVYKDECIYCFNTPTSDGGLYICLSSLLGLCSHHLKLHVRKTQKTVFLHVQKIAKEKPYDEEGPPDKKPTKLAIGVEGGFDVNQDKIEYDDIAALVVTDHLGKDCLRRVLPDHTLPLNAQLSIAAVLSHQGAALVDDVQAWEEKRNISRHSENLIQHFNGVKIPPRGWQCARCDLTQNLWLNLTDGTILCGRKYFDGSGGNNHALDYFKETGYPLSVKLGTITAAGGDVYSYEEDDMVEDPKLAQHLAHFGINIASLEKTDKTMTELEIEANLSIKAEWDLIQEAGKKLAPCYGPGYTGMINLGNSCYLNSVLQVLFTIPEIAQRYATCSQEIFEKSGRDAPVDFNAQMAKVGWGLHSGIYSQPPDTGHDDPVPLGIRPQMFKALVGRGHAEFSTNRQQDAQDFFMHLLGLIEQDEKSAFRQGLSCKVNPKDLFAFQFEDRIECSVTNKVAYQRREDIAWVLPIPLNAATNQEEYLRFDELRKVAEAQKQRIDPVNVVRLKIPLLACIDAFMQTEHIEDFHSTAIHRKTTARKSCKFASFPDYLVIQLRKFTISEDWTPKKLDVSVDVPSVLDLSMYRSYGLQPGEVELPKDDSQDQTQETSLQVNEAYVAQLLDMGFPREACVRAVYFTDNAGIEAAMNWVFEHSSDPDFAEPLPMARGPSSSDVFDAEDLGLITSMGFTEAQAKKALKATGNNVEAAADWIFSHMDDLANIEAEVAHRPETPTPQQPAYKDGSEKYELFAFISHMGTSTSCGHYVCHIHKDRRWVIYNDRKVAVSEAPPLDLGYIYFYRRLPGS